MKKRKAKKRYYVNVYGSLEDGKEWVVFGGTLTTNKQDSQQLINQNMPFITTKTIYL